MPAKTPDPNVIQPIVNVEALTFVKPDVKNQNIIVGDFTYFADKDFERHVTHHYDFIGDKLIIGASSVVASDVTPYTIVAGTKQLESFIKAVDHSLKAPALKSQVKSDFLSGVSGLRKLSRLRKKNGF